MPNFPDKLKNILWGTPWGSVFPAKANPPPLAIDGRTAALRILREYVANLDFYRAMGPGIPPKKFNVPESQFFIEWPDSTEQMTLPCVAVVHSRADYDVIGLVSYLEEDTRDLFAPGTVLQWQAEYVETINLEIWCSKKSERRAMLAGMETAFSPTEQMSGLRFKMPEYFGELVCFTLNRREIMDDPDSMRNRRRAHLEMEMRFNIVALVNYMPLESTVNVNTDVVQPSNLPVVVKEASGDLADVLAKQAADPTQGPPNPIFAPPPLSNYPK